VIVFAGALLAVFAVGLMLGVLMGSAMRDRIWRERINLAARIRERG
jgi:hypothetical protein